MNSVCSQEARQGEEHEFVSVLAPLFFALVVPSLSAAADAAAVVRSATAQLLSFATLPAVDGTVGAFRALLSEADWRQLPPAVQRRFERALAPGESAVYLGEVASTELTRAGWWWAQLARLMGAPLPLKVLTHTPAAVVVTADAVGDTQLWTRIYRETGRLPQVIRSMKSFSGSTGLEERVGAGIGMALVVSVETRALVFRSAEYRWRCGRFSCRIPHWLTPGSIEVRHREERAGRFSFTLTVVHPWFGRIIHQVAFFRDAC